MVGGGYFKQDPVFSADRKISRFPAPSPTSATALQLRHAPGRFIVTDPNTGQDIDATLRQALQPGQRPIYNPADPTGPSGSFKDFTTADRFNFQPFNYIMTPLERLSLYASVTQDIHRQDPLRGGPPRRAQVGQPGGAAAALRRARRGQRQPATTPSSVDATNPFNPFGFTLQQGTYAFIGRRLVEAGPAHYEQTVDTWNVSGSFDGEFEVMDRNCTGT